MAKEDGGGGGYGVEQSGGGGGGLDLGGLEIRKMDRHPLPNKLNQKCPHKKTDFRYKMWVKERKVIKLPPLTCLALQFLNFLLKAFFGFDFLL